MLTNMFIGNPPGNYDRILDFSTAVTGGLFFVPTMRLPRRSTDRPSRRGRDGAHDARGNEPQHGDGAASDGSLRIGSLRGASTMNHLLRSHAPISEAGWELLDDEARERLEPALAARKLVDFSGPHGWEHSATNLGRTAPLEAARRARASTASPAPGAAAGRAARRLRDLPRGASRRRPRRRRRRSRAARPRRAPDRRGRERRRLPRLGRRDQRHRRGFAPRSRAARRRP